MQQFLIIWLLLIGSSIQLKDVGDDDRKERSSISNETIVGHDRTPDHTNHSGRPALISTEQNLREARSNYFSNVQSQLKKTNPRLLQYFANQQNHVFNDIMRKLAHDNGTTYNQNPNSTLNRDSNTIDLNKSTKDLFYQVSDDVHPDNNNYHKYGHHSSKAEKPNSKFDTDYESMHAHETQNSDSKDPMSKYAQIKELIANAEDGKNIGMGLSNMPGHYVPAEPFANGDLQDLTSCCDQLFHKYGNKNYLHEDVFIIPRMDDLSRPPRPSPFDARSPLLVGYRPPPPPLPLSSGSPLLADQQPNRIPVPIPKDKITEIECIDHHLHNGMNGHHVIAAHPIITTSGSLAQAPLVPLHSIDHHPSNLVPVHRYDSPTNRNDPSMHGTLLPVPQHHFETPRMINGNRIAHSSWAGYGLPSGGYHGQSISPVQANHRLLISNELGMSQRRANYLAPPVFQINAHPTTAPTLLSRKLSLLGKKYLLG